MESQSVLGHVGLIKRTNCVQCVHCGNPGLQPGERPPGEKESTGKVAKQPGGASRASCRPHARARKRPDPMRRRPCQPRHLTMGAFPRAQANFPGPGPSSIRQWDAPVGQRAGAISLRHTPPRWGKGVAGQHGCEELQSARQIRFGSSAREILTDSRRPPGDGRQVSWRGQSEMTIHVRPHEQRF